LSVLFGAAKLAELPGRGRRLFRFHLPETLAVEKILIVLEKARVGRKAVLVNGDVIRGKFLPTLMREKKTRSKSAYIHNKTGAQCNFLGWRFGCFDPFLGVKVRW